MIFDIFLALSVLVTSYEVVISKEKYLYLDVETYGTYSVNKDVFGTMSYCEPPPACQSLGFPKQLPFTPLLC